MRNMGIVIVIIAVALGIFGYWGMHTVAGRKRFDEMAGMIPMFAQVAAGILGVIGIVLLVIAMNRSSP